MYINLGWAQHAAAAAGRQHPEGGVLDGIQAANHEVQLIHRAHRYYHAHALVRADGDAHYLSLPQLAP